MNKFNSTAPWCKFWNKIFKSWPQFLLKFIVSHPAVTCSIPATSSVAHVVENLGAARGRLPDEATRRRMTGYIRSL